MCQGLQCEWTAKWKKLREIHHESWKGHSTSRAHSASRLQGPSDPCTMCVFVFCLCLCVLQGEACRGCHKTPLQPSRKSRKFPAVPLAKSEKRNREEGDYHRSLLLKKGCEVLGSREVVRDMSWQTLTHWLEKNEINLNGIFFYFFLHNWRHHI